MEKVLIWGQAQAKPFHNQWGNQTGPRRGRNKWAQSGGGESGSPGKQGQGRGRVALLAAELGPGLQQSQARSFVGLDNDEMPSKVSISRKCLL